MPRTAVRMKPCGSLEPGWMNLAIIPAMKPMMIVQMMCHMEAVLYCCAGSGKPILGRKSFPDNLRLSILIQHSQCVYARCKRAAWNDEYMFQLLAGRSQSLMKPQ